MHRLVGPLGAVLARAQAAVDADRGDQVRITDPERLRVDDLARVLDRAAQRHRQPVVLAVAAQHRAVAGAKIELGSGVAAAQEWYRTGSANSLKIAAE